MHIRSGRSPYHGADNSVAYSLWDEALPVVPATAWLQHLHRNGLEESTREGYAVAALHLFKFLKQDEIGFWDLEGRHIQSFKSYLNQLGLKPTTRKAYLSAVSQLIAWAMSPAERKRFFGEQAKGPARRKPGKGVMAKLQSDAIADPDLFSIRIRNKSNTYRKHGLPPALQQRVWDALETAFPPRPRKPESLKYRQAKMLWYRNRAIWALLIMSAPRKSELIRIGLDDLDPEAGTIAVVDRPEHRQLGRLKLGERILWFPTAHPYMRFVDEWLLYGRQLAEEIIAEKQVPDHRLLFCTITGSPMTRGAVHHLFDTLAKKLGIDKKTRPFSCHIARHTGATILKKAGADPGAIQAYLGHGSINSQDAYTALDTPDIREMLTRCWSNGPVILPDQKSA
jgi:integrase/recombinase XerC